MHTPMLLPSLWMLRHAPPQIAPGLCYGQLDVPAAELATQQAAKNFAAVAPHGVRIRTSPLQRCELLALALQGLRPDLMLKTADPCLRELDFGSWEGQPWHALPRRHLDAWAADLAGYRPGGGENLQAMLQRVAQALVCSWQTDAQGGQQHCIWVCHAGTMRCVQWLLEYGQQLPSSAQWSMPAASAGQWLRVPWPAALALDLQRLAQR